MALFLRLLAFFGRLCARTEKPPQPGQGDTPMTTRYPASETDPTGADVETDNASLSNSPSVRLPQASDPCQADILNAPAKELRDRLALVEAGCVWHEGATNAPVNAQQIKLKLMAGDAVFAETRLGLGGYSFSCKYNNYNQTNPYVETEITPASIKLICGPSYQRGVQISASRETLYIASVLASNCTVQITGELTASSNISAGGNISSGGNVSAEGNISASAKAKAKNLPAHIIGYYSSSSGKWHVIADGATISSSRSTWADVVSDIISWCDSNGFTGYGYTLYFSADPTDLTAIGNSALKPGGPNAESIPVTAKAFVFYIWPPAS